MSEDKRMQELQEYLMEFFDLGEKEIIRYNNFNIPLHINFGETVESTEYKPFSAQKILTGTGGFSVSNKLIVRGDDGHMYSISYSVHGTLKKL